MKSVEKITNTSGIFTNYIYKAIPLAFDESMSYYETLLGLLNYLKETILPTINNNADALAELQNLMTTLQNYVDNYFNNLDVQDEINNKLDKMVDDGAFENILNKFINNSLYRCYENVEELKKSNLTINQYAITSGYYNKGDGGNAKYYISNTPDTNKIYETLDNGNYAILITTVCNILQCGASQSLDDNSEIIQKCLNLYKDVYIPNGTYKLSTLQLNSYNHLYGNGNNSILSAINESNDGLINIKDTNTHTIIENLHLVGNNLNLDGILISRNEQTSIDSNEIFNNINIELFGKKGINLNSTYIRSCFIKNCNISNNGDDGIYIKGTDNFIDNTLSYWNKGNGIYIQDGSSNKINNSKVFGNSKNGLFINGSSTQINNVESQDNYLCGILNQQCWGNQYTNVVSSTNGLNSTEGSNYSNIKFINSYDSYYEGTILNRLSNQSQIMHSKYGLEIENSSNITTNIKLHLYNIDLTPFKNENLNISNKININNINYNITNLYENMLIGKEGSTSGLSQLFTSSNIRDNSNGSINCNLIENAQNINIGNNTTTDITSRVSVSGNIEVSNVNNVSFYMSGSNNKTSSQSQVGAILDFLNESGGLISSSNNVIGYNSAAINSAIPENTKSIKYTIYYMPLILNLNGTFSLNNIQIGTY